MNATLTDAPRQRKPRPKPVRQISLRIKPDGTSPGIVRITAGKKEADYFLTEIPSDFGRGFKVEKIGLHAEGNYAVNIDGDTKRCDCKGHTHHGHCKHADGIAELIAAGQL